MKVVKTCVLLLCFSLSPQLTANIKPTTTQDNISIQSDSLEYNHKTGYATYKGNVIVKQTDKTLTADHITITKNNAGKFTKMQARGKPARYEGMVTPDKPKIIATAKTISYLPMKQQLILKGKAKLIKGNEIFSSPSINFDLEQQMVSSKGDNNSRPTLIIENS